MKIERIGLKNSKNIVLTGHLGLIGSFLKDRLESEGHRITKGIDLREGSDILDIDHLGIEDNVDMMIHSAAHCKINQAIQNPRLNYVSDVEGTFRVLEFCRKNKIPKVVYFSSSRVLSEEKNPYTAAKTYGEELCKAYHDSYGIDSLIIRPSTVYAPFWDKTERLMHRFITSAFGDENLKIYGNPKTKTLDFTYIDDFVEGVMLAMNNPEWNKEYNISGGEESNVYELAEFVIAWIGSKSKIEICDAEVAQPQKVNLDISEISKLGYSPKIKLEEGVMKTIDFYT